MYNQLYLIFFIEVCITLYNQLLIFIINPHCLYI